MRNEILWAVMLSFVSVLLIPDNVVASPRIVVAEEWTNWG